MEGKRSAGTHTFNSFDPSWLTRVRLPTISVGNTRSSRIFSCTFVKVRLRGRFCLTRDVRVGLRRIRRCATKTTCRSENFFSNSRVSLRLICKNDIRCEYADSRYPALRNQDGRTRQDVPCLNLMEGLQLGDGHEHNDRLFSPTHVHLACGRNLQGAQVRLEFGHTVLKINERLCNGRLGFIGLGGWRVRRTMDFVLHGHDKAVLFLSG